MFCRLKVFIVVVIGRRRGGTEGGGGGVEEDEGDELSISRGVSREDVLDDNEVDAGLLRLPLPDPERRDLSTEAIIIVSNSPKFSTTMLLSLLILSRC